MKSTVVIYYSMGGTAKETAVKLKSKDPDNIDIVDIVQKPNVDISRYKTVYIGSGVYRASLPEELSKFVKVNKATLQQKNVYIYIHALNSKEKHLDIVKKAFGDSITVPKQNIFYLGGKADMAKQKGFIKLILAVGTRLKKLDTQHPNTIEQVQINKLLKTVEKK